MPRHPSYVPHGVIPACLLPFHPDLSIDEASYRKHLRDVTAVRGLSAITVNAHASEVASCTFDEQERVLAITMDEVGAKIPVVNGIYADGSLEGARLARMAQRAAHRPARLSAESARARRSRPEMAIAHFKRSPTRPICRSSASSIRSRAGSAIRATR